jgi:hypothetical protein
VATDLSREVREAWKEFKKFFTVKNIIVTIIVLLALAIVCGPTVSESHDDCGENSCPMRLHDNLR